MVMNGARFSDTIRNIGKHGVSFIAIVIITCIAAMAYLGVNNASRAMKIAGEKFYDSTDYMDVEMIASLLMSEQDLEEIKNVEGVEDVEGIYKTEGFANRIPVKIRTVTERISVPELIEGKLPEAANECVVELPSSQSERDAFVVGKEIKITGEDGKRARYLGVHTFKITGIVRHPDHLSVKLPEDPYVLVNASAFDKKAMEGDYLMGALIRIRDAEGINSFDSEYFSAIKPTVDSLEKLAVERAKVRDDEIYQKGQNEINKVQTKLDAQKKRLDSDRSSLDRETKNLKDRKNNLTEKKQQLDADKKELDERKKELEQEKKDLDEQKKSLEKDEKKLDETRDNLAEDYRDIISRKNEIKNTFISVYHNVLTPDHFGRLKWVDDEVERDINDKEVVADDLAMTKTYTADLSMSLEDVAEELLEDVGLYDDEIEAYMPDIKSDKSFIGIQKKYHDLSGMTSDWDEKHEAYLDKLEEFRKGPTKKYEAREKEYNKKYNKYEDDLARWNDRYNDYRDLNSAFKKSRKTLESRERTYAGKEQSYENGISGVNDMKIRLENLEQCKWFQFTRAANPSYIDLNMIAGNLAKIGFSFSLLFILLGAIVCYATVGRMVDEDSRLIGIAKAQGLRNSEIFIKYDVFGILATAVGICIGIALASGPLQTKILDAVAGIYVFDKIPGTFLGGPAGIILAVGILIAIFAVAFAALRIMGSSVSSLMSGNAHRIATSVSDRKRVAVSIASVAGCCALVVIGLTIKHAVGGVMDIQYGSIVKYDANLDYNPYENGNAEKDLQNIMDMAGARYYGIYETNLTYRLDAGESFEVGELMVVPDNGIQNFYALHEAGSGRLLEVPDDGLLLQKRLAETYAVSEGDKITVYDRYGKGREVTVDGIFENYAGRTMIMGTSCYRTLFGDQVANNRYLVKVSEQGQREMGEELVNVRGFVSLKAADGARGLFESIDRSLNALVALFVTMAVVLAVFVLLDFANLYVWQKRRELTLMRLNGFRMNEMIRYISKEPLVSSAIGIVFGVGIGAGISYWIVRLLEQPHIQLVRQPDFVAWGIAAVFTAIVSFVIYRISFLRIRSLKVGSLEES